MRYFASQCKVRILVRVTVLATGMFAACLEVPGQPQDAAQQVRARFEIAARQACSDRGVTGCLLSSVTSENVTPFVNLYRAVLRIGPGPFDLIGINRLVNEQHPGKATDGNAAVFCIHGTSQNFFDSFVNKSMLSDNPGFAVWLAQRGIDVWGIDLRFAFVPATTADFGFMAGWNFGTMVQDVLLGTRFARHARRVTGQHFGKVHLVGRSLGASLVYGVANAEAILAEEEQDAGDLIPVETVYKLPPADTIGKTRACGYETAYTNALAAGTYYIDQRPTMAIGAAAKNNPNGASPLAGYTNKEYALRSACANIMVPGFPYHSVACLLDERGIPIAGRFSSTTLIIDSLVNGIPTRPRALMRDYFQIACDTHPTPYDDHLSAIRIPSLYIGVAGGFGESGLYTNSMLGSADKATIFVRMLPVGHENEDFGHIESYIGNDAASLVWEPVLNWVLAHEVARH